MFIRRSIRKTHKYSFIGDVTEIVIVLLVRLRGNIDVTKACEGDIDRLETGIVDLKVEVLLTNPNLNELVERNNIKSFKIRINCESGESVHIRQSNVKNLLNQTLDLIKLSCVLY